MDFPPFSHFTIIKNISRLNVRHAFQNSYPGNEKSPLDSSMIFGISMCENLYGEIFRSKRGGNCRSAENFWVRLPPDPTQPGGHKFRKNNNSYLKDFHIKIFTYLRWDAFTWFQILFNEKLDGLCWFLLVFTVYPHPMDPFRTLASRGSDGQPTPK